VACDGRHLINLAGNDYLGLAHHPHLKAAARAAIETHGTGSGASRLITGNSPAHTALEDRFAAFKGHEAALLFPTGYMANAAVLHALPQRDDLLCIDKLNHASLVEAAKQSRAVCRVFPHAHMEKLERLLVRHRATAPAPAHRFIVTDTVFSMDGDVSDLRDLCVLARRHDAIIIADEAHATGVLGPKGGGLVEHLGLGDDVAIVISTASKALGSLGGIVSGPRVVIEALVNRAPQFIFTTAPPMAQVAAIDAALDVVRDEPWRRTRLAEMATKLRAALGSLPWPDRPVTAQNPPTPIIPLVVGTAAAALDLQRHLTDYGFCGPAVRPPAVPLGTSRIRLSLRADLTDADIEALVHALKAWTPKRGQ